MKDVKAAVDDLASWRNTGLLSLNKPESLRKLHLVDDMFRNTIDGLESIGDALNSQYIMLEDGDVIDNKISFLPPGTSHSPSVHTAAAHARELTKKHYSRRFNMSEDQSRLFDINLVASNMQEARRELEVLRQECRLLIMAVEAEPDVIAAHDGPNPASISWRHALDSSKIVLNILLHLGNLLMAAVVAANKGIVAILELAWTRNEPLATRKQKRQKSEDEVGLACEKVMRPDSAVDLKTCGAIGGLSGVD